MTAKHKLPVEKQADTVQESHFLQRHPLIMPLISFVVLFMIGLGAFVSIGGQTVGASDTHIAIVYYDGKEQTVPTRAKNVEDLLQRLTITIGAKDIVEPSQTTPIVEDNFTVNVYRSRSVEIVDGQNRTIIQTASKSPRVVAKEASISLFAEDTVSFVRAESDLKGPIVAERLVIERSIPLQVSLYGVLGQYRTTAKTIAGFLEQKNILLKSGDTTQPANVEEALVPGMLLSINAEGRSIISVEEPIPFGVQTRNNPDVLAGKQTTVQEGVLGKRAVLYEQIMQDGAEVDRRQIQTVTLVEPVAQIIEKGTLAAATYSVSNDKAALMAAAGIDPSQFASVDYIIQKESNWRPGAINSQGCIGLAQRCSIGGNNALVAACPNWQTDPVCQLNHFSAYANERYGSWNNAYQVWVVQRWW
jgi:uncharacterized protein YabE (DUF348 family)